MIVKEIQKSGYYVSIRIEETPRDLVKIISTFKNKKVINKQILFQNTEELKLLKQAIDEFLKERENGNN